VASNLLRTDRPLILSIVGTRPEAIKMGPVVRALAGRPALRQELILTGQHKGIDEEFGLSKRSIHQLDINLAEQTAGEIREALHEALLRRISRRRPDLVLVQGDTTSALAGALAARDCKVPVGHVEAGLRSGDIQQPWPEEGNRIRIDAMADLLFAPSETAAQNLSAEERVTGRVHVTGNSGIDALLHARLSCPIQSAGERKTVLVTCHRRENQGPELARVAEALKRLVRELPLDIVFPLHTNPHLRLAVKRLLGGEPHIALIDPVGHREMVRLMERCWLILTDSGGLQEEGPALGKPVLVLRNTTERTEGVASANVALVGTDPERIFEAVDTLLQDEEHYGSMSEPHFPFGDGQAAPRIADIIEDFLLSQPLAMAAMPPMRN
jgi:UDP-N-acetylglucosamine 2-epimerase